jgi:hypothetical protein
MTLSRRVKTRIKHCIHITPRWKREVSPLSLISSDRQMITITFRINKKSNKSKKRTTTKMTTNRKRRKTIVFLRGKRSREKKMTFIGFRSKRIK